MRGETHFCRKSPPPTPTFGILRAQAGHSARPILTRHDRAYIKRTKIIRCNRNIITDKTLLSLQEALAASVKTNKQVKQNNCRLEDAERKNIHLTGTNANTQHSAGEALIKNTHTHIHHVTCDRSKQTTHRASSIRILWPRWNTPPSGPCK